MRPDGTPNYRTAALNDIAAKYTEPGQDIRVFPRNGTPLDAKTVGVEQTKQPSNPRVRIRVGNNETLIGAGTTVVVLPEY